MTRLKTLLVASMLLPVITCEKKSECETWEIDQQAQVTGCYFTLGCGNETITRDLCGEDLMDARAGKVKTFDAGCCKKTWYPIRKIR